MPVAAVAAVTRGDRQAGAGADQGRLQGAAARHRRRRGDEARRADPARPPADRGRRSAGHQAVEHRQAHRVQEGRRQGGLRRGRGRDREATTPRRPCTRAISSRTPRWRAPAEDGQVQVWSTTQGHFQVRGFCARLLGIETSQIRVTPTEIGGGFGGKTVVYLEPLAMRLAEVGQAGEDDHGARGRVPRLRPRAGRGDATRCLWRSHISHSQDRYRRFTGGTTVEAGRMSCLHTGSA